jgi:pimeloyl-ACP methyl ester carboxylesterase
MPDLPLERARRVFTAIGTAAVILLFLASLFLIVLTNRFSPTVAAERPPSTAPGGGSIAYLGDFAISYRTTGTNRGRPPVILLLGNPGASGIGYHDGFRFLDSSRQLISYDPRGSGLSQVKPSLSYYTMSALATELEAVREHIAKAESVVVIGHGFGAALAVRYAREYPGRVDRLILLSPMPPDGIRYASVLALLGETAGAVAAAGIPPSDPEAADRWQNRYTLSTDRTLEADPAMAARLGLPRASFGSARSLLTSLSSSRQWTAGDVTPLPITTLTITGPADAVPDILSVLFPGMRTVHLAVIPHPLTLPHNPTIADTILQFLNERT